MMNDEDENDDDDDDEADDDDDDDDIDVDDDDDINNKVNENTQPYKNCIGVETRVGNEQIVFYFVEPKFNKNNYTL